MRIICDRCGKQYVIGSLECYQNLIAHALRKGWIKTETGVECPKHTEVKNDIP